MKIVLRVLLKYICVGTRYSKRFAYVSKALNPNPIATRRPNTTTKILKVKRVTTNQMESDGATFFYYLKKLDLLKLNGLYSDETVRAIISNAVRRRTIRWMLVAKNGQSVMQTLKATCQ